MAKRRKRHAARDGEGAAALSVAGDSPAADAAEANVSHAGAAPPADHYTLIVCVALVAITCFVFGQTREYGFVNYDDPGYVSENAAVLGGLSMAGVVWAFTNTHGGNWHPLTTMSHMLDCELFGARAGMHHVVNVLLHSTAAVLLFLVWQRMTGALWSSAFVAAVFAIHPLRAESVAWISERKDVLSGLFFMLTLAAYTHYARAVSVRRYALVAVTFALGLMSKPMLVTTPAVLLLLDYWPLKRIDDRRALWKLALEKLPLLLMSVAMAIGTIVAQSRTHAVESMSVMPMSWRINNAVVSTVTYLRELVWPSGLAAFYPHPEGSLSSLTVAAAGLLLIAITSAALLLRKSRPYLFVGWFWYIVMLVPVIGVVQAGLQGQADRYTYLPQIGLSVMITWAVADVSSGWVHRPQVLAVGGACVTASLAAAAMIQTGYWRDSETLWTRALAVTSNNDVAHTNLSQVLLTTGRPREALPQCEAAVKARPDNAQAWTNLGLASEQTGDVARAVAAWERSLELRPGGLSAEANLAWALATSPNDALRNGARAVALAEDACAQTNYSDAPLLRTLAAAYAEAGRFDDAVKTATKARDVAHARGDTSTAANLAFHIENYRANLRLRDQSLGVARADQVPRAAEE
jgi:tetratricopeptide (TPR) repeat protein